MDRSTSMSFARRLPAAALSLGLLTVVALTGCDSGTQEPDAPAATATEFGAAPVPEAPAPVAVPTEQPADGSIAAERFPTEMPDGFEAAIPATFPRSIPIYPGATPALGSGATKGDSARAGVQLLSNDSASDVYSFYEKELSSNGWEVSDAQNVGGMASISASNGSAQVSLFIQPSADGGSDLFVVAQEPAS
jgi:hypothetical protein